MIDINDSANDVFLEFTQAVERRSTKFGDSTFSTTAMAYRTGFYEDTIRSLMQGNPEAVIAIERATRVLKSMIETDL